MTIEQVGIIDLGTNTFHLIIAQIDEREHYVIKGKYKEPVQLGEGGINSGKITGEAFKRGIRALKTFRTILTTSGITKVFAFATSAIRSASNGAEFIKTAKEEAEIDIKVINGNEEASLIFEGIKNGVQIPFEERVLLVDIGGGSVEFIVAHEGRAELLRSLNIGGARLLARIEPSNPMKPKEIAATYKLLEKEMASLIKELKEFDLTMLIGSSGTSETLGSLVASRKKDKISATNINGYRFTRSEFEQVYAVLLNTEKAERMKMDGMEPLRADMIVLGACLINYVLRELGIERIMISSFALKEGILHRYIREKKNRLAQFMGHSEQNLRARAVQNLALKFKYEQDHALKVSELATQLFDGLQSLHNLDKPERELLQYACMLHDIGKFIHVSGHHKHGQYIIANSNLSGFNTTELLLISNIVRYHRRSHPKVEHLSFSPLSDLDKNIVRFLAGVLRIADNLDRGHREFVTHLEIHIYTEKIVIEVHATHEVEMEVKFASDNSSLLEAVLETKVEIVQV